MVFDSVDALSGVNIQLYSGEILGLIGPNGAGKTTLINSITGFVDRTQGVIVLDGKDISDLPSYALASLGVVRTFQGVRVFRELSVFENVEIGPLGIGISRRNARQRASEALESVDLTAVRFDRARSLPHPAQRRLELARAIAMQPNYLLLDEPAAGLTEGESDDLMESIRAFNTRSGAGVLLIEHDMRVIMGLCNRIHVLNFGKTITVGEPAAVRSDADVVTAYLGGGDREAERRSHA